ncbi:MAG: hypothetical protein KGQ59_09835, partial [Bdellovibrionales bacterium]|nr:hypothetical protein [Bdellovibrionales bacterium]
MRPQWHNHLLLATATLAISFCFLISPLMVRSLMDGIMVTGDITAMSVAIFSIALCEIASVVLNVVVRHEFDHQQNSYVSDTQRAFLERWASGEIQPSKKDAQRFWFSDIGRVAAIHIRQRWARIQDITLVLVLGTVAIAINTVSGLFLFGVIASQVITGLFFNVRWGASQYAARNLHEKEEDLLHGVTTSIQKWRDQGEIREELDLIHQQLEQNHRKRLEIDRIRSATEDTFRSFRSIAIVGVLCLAFKSVADGSGSMGSVWALIMVTYRLLGPTASLSKWFLEDKRARQQLDRWNRWIHLKTQIRNDLPPHYSAAKAVLQSSAEKKHSFFILADQDARSSFLECSRIWRDRVSKRTQVLIFDGSMSHFPEAKNQSAGKRLFILSGFSSNLHALNDIRKSLSLLVHQPETSFIILDSVPWMNDLSGLQLMQIESDGKKIEIQKAKLTDTGELSIFEQQVLKNWSEQDPRFGVLNRDLIRFSRMNVQMSVGHLRAPSPELLS